MEIKETAADTSKRNLTGGKLYVAESVRVRQHMQAVVVTPYATRGHVKLVDRAAISCPLSTAATGTLAMEASQCHSLGDCSCQVNVSAGGRVSRA